MRAFSLLVFSTVYLHFSGPTPVLAAKNKPLDLKASPKVEVESPADSLLQSSNTLNTGGFCYDIYAGKNKVGFILETKVFNKKTGHHEHKSYTHIQTKSSSLEEQLNTVSDAYLTPISFDYKLTTDKKISKEISGKFKKNAKDLKADFKVQVQNKKPKVQSLDVPKGSVFLSAATDLIFLQKKIDEINPQNQMLTSAFDAKTAQLKTLKTHLDQSSDAIKFIHTIDDKSYSTEHTYSGHMLRSEDQRQNISLTKCNTITPHLKTAESLNYYKTFFAKKEKEILQSCCQL